eukprot:TRINITY_DN20206_c0_g1_i1.p1 TRINITY_DN20206_c0_g1~~TRINITY_DN20206_c0_g1_i1.p1  ORF type:complete len:426 (+),score=72.02 TRINITY_DN20206_c0_g1_i1:178-1278(+)
MDQMFYPEDDDRDTIFQAALTEGNQIFFRHLRIRPDGGLGKRGVSDQLFTKHRACQALVMLGFVGFNTIMVIVNLSLVLRHRQFDEGSFKFTLLLDFHDQSTAEHYWLMQLCVSIFECVAMLSMLAYCFFVVLKYNLFISRVEMQQYRIWHQLYFICCILIHTMTNFSAMKTLQFLNPQVVGSQLALALTKVEEGHSYFRVLTTFAISHFVFGILGFLAFVIKLSQLVVQLRVRMEGSAYDALEVGAEIALLFGFINQVFGITQIWQVETQRLFLFIFGGEDSKMQAGEIDRQEVYLASVAHLVCTNLFTDEPLARRKWRRAVALLTFTHLDVQSLVLAEDERLEVDARTLREAHSPNRPVCAQTS